MVALRIQKGCAESPLQARSNGDGLSKAVKERANRANAHPAKVRVLVIDDHPVVCSGIEDLLASHDWLLVVDKALDGRQGFEKAIALKPDVVVVDINLPKLNGLALMKKLRAELPDAKILVLSMHEPEQFGFSIIENGARGYVSKKVASSELVSALEVIANGGTYFEPAFSQIVLNHFSRRHSARVSLMSPREQQVLIGIADGLSNKEIATRLNLGVRTVDTHRERLIRKLNIHSVAGLTKFAVQQGLVA